MTAKSRQRKIRIKLKSLPKVDTKKYKFDNEVHPVVIEAASLAEARTIFQQKYGYWPNKENTDDNE